MVIDVPQRGQWRPVQESSSWPHAQMSLRADRALSSGWRLAQAWRSVVIVVTSLVGFVLGVLPEGVDRPTA